jgi:hypothetical protein
MVRVITMSWRSPAAVAPGGLITGISILRRRPDEAPAGPPDGGGRSPLSAQRRAPAMSPARAVPGPCVRFNCWRACAAT